MRKFVTWILPVIFLFLCLGVIVLGKMTRIDCRSQFGECSDEVEQAVSGVSTGKNFWKTKAMVAQALDGISRVYEAEIIWDFPGKVTVYVIERRAEVALVREGEAYLLIDREGEELGMASETQLPRLYIRAADVDKEEILNAAGLLFEFYRREGVEYALIEDDGLVVQLSDGLKVILPLEGEIDVLMGRLLLVQQWLKANPREIRITLADLRYDNAVLR